ncbi:MAG: DUF502 domain-containing protein [Planctomycetales bacterium]|nr:DUF502 domain-containing protein [Planctomycetales bacterium]
MSQPHLTIEPQQKRPLDPFRRAVLRGLGILLPPLLTIVIFLWVGATVNKYILTPLEDWTRWVVVQYASDIREASEFPQPPERADVAIHGRVYQRQVGKLDGEDYVRTDSGKFVPQSVYLSAADALLAEGETVEEHMPSTAKAVYTLHREHVTLRRERTVPLFLAVFVLLLYLLGKFLAAGVGRFFWSQIESIIHRLPVVRNVYSSVKQVTDFLFTDPEMEFTRVVAVEYPRKGIWTVAFVTGESMLDIESAANEPIMSVLIPTSPMPFTGFTVTVRKSEILDLNITIDQAFQFIVSCGVVVPPHQLSAALADRDRKQSSLPPRSEK